MSNNGWFTINDVVVDLEKAMGQRLDNIDSKFTVTGDAPPPINLTEEEDEFLRINTKFVSKGAKTIEPDLVGIRQMVRLVNDNDDRPTFDENANIQHLKQKAKTVVSISKLNPNVSEFVPQKVTDGCIPNGGESTPIISEASTSSNISAVESPNKPCLTGSCNENLDCKQTKKTDAEDAKHTDVDINKRIDVSNLNIVEINSLKEKLKLKIIDTSKADCPRKKRERNLAIASLLKLNTNIPKPPAEHEAIKLMTPEFYNTGAKEIKTKSFDAGINQNTPVVNETANKSANKIITQKPENVDSTQSVNSKHASDTYNSPTTSSQGVSDNAQSEPAMKEDNANFNRSKEILESVKKVDDWFNKPEKPKPKPMLHLGPFTYKTKDTSRSHKGENDVGLGNDIPPRPHSAQYSECFVPSSYAEELSKKYAKNSELRQLRSEDIWTRVERQLKEKDKAIRESNKQKEV